MGSDFQYLQVEVDGHVATVTLDRPPVNAVNQMMYREIRTLFSEISHMGHDVRAVVLTGAGKHFCGGNDLDEFVSMAPDNSPERMFHVREAFWAIYTSEVPVIAAVHGVALGTGLALAASCDIIIASEDARLGLPEIKVGVMGGARHLSRLVPPNVVRYMFYTGEPLPASEFVRYGSVLKVVSREKLLDEARSVAGSFARHSPVALAYAKRALNHVEHSDLKHGYEFEQSLTGELSGHPHAKEALRALMEKREPDFAAS